MRSRDGKFSKKIFSSYLCRDIERKGHYYIEDYLKYKDFKVIIKIVGEKYIKNKLSTSIAHYAHEDMRNMMSCDTNIDY